MAHLHNTTIYTLPKSTIKTLSKKPKKVLDKGHTPCYNNQAVSRGGQPLKLVATACMAILKPKGFKKISKKVLDKRTFMRYNIQAVTKQVTAQQDLEN